jgi:hypothetical protein
MSGLGTQVRKIGYCCNLSHLAATVQRRTLRFEQHERNVAAARVGHTLSRLPVALIC